MPYAKFEIIRASCSGGSIPSPSKGLVAGEVLYLCEQHPGLVVVIDHTVEPATASEIAKHRITFRLKKEATVRDVVWELSGLSGHAVM